MKEDISSRHENKTEDSILTSENIDFRGKTITGTEGHYIIIKGSTNQQGMMGLNVYV